MKIHNYLLLFCTILFFLIVFELVLANFYPQNLKRTEGLYQFDKKYGFSMAEGFAGRQVAIDCNVSIRTNTKGLRDREYNSKKPKNTFRILVLGDSFTFGSCVEENETYPKVLENFLNTPKRFYSI